MRHHFNPRAPYGARLKQRTHSSYLSRISIHAPHTGRDPGPSRWRARPRYFNPRAPYGARPTTTREIPRTKGFQSTRPIRGATGGQARSHRRGDISIHAPHTGRDGSVKVPIRNKHGISIHAPHTGRDLNSDGTVAWAYRISIHAPHTGRDPSRRGLRSQRAAFQSTRPIRGATGAILSLPRRPLDFNPRAPYGARPPSSTTTARP